ncbi:hypothetical protein E3983_10175 [Legionella israelensis]|uniref:Glyoxalase-related protein domain-containing protein n=1 Tax=Legionella israelensis TaxID=454 RepID=A0AAX1EIR5_9GAMM|nr:glyoxalase superfamily protein [Legionella israelensis]QBR84699.1 hypothetical protein E3983_10175 [Legionella israelensis]
MVTLPQVKKQASILKDFLNKQNNSITHSSCLEAISKIHGFPNWNTASALIEKQSNNQTNISNYPFHPDIMDGMMHAFFGYDESPLMLKYIYSDANEITGVQLTLKTPSQPGSQTEFFITGRLKNEAKLTENGSKEHFHLIGMQLVSKIQELAPIIYQEENEPIKYPGGLTQTNILKAVLSNRNKENHRAKVKLNYKDRALQNKLRIVEKYLSDLPEVHNPLVFAKNISAFINAFFDSEFQVKCTTKHIEVEKNEKCIAIITGGNAEDII